MFEIESHRLITLELAIKQGGFPRYIYKYRFLNEHTKDLLTNNTLYFANPKTFNDPFDCQLNPNLEFNNNDIKQWINSFSTEKSRSERRKKISAYQKDKSTFVRHIQTTCKDFQNDVAVCSFAGINDDILLWSHYGDSHRGICIKFDILKSLETFSFPVPVIYQKEYPVFNHITNPEDRNYLLQFMYSTKSIKWEYEKEIRFLKDKPGGHTFNPNSLVEVTFGCNIDSKMKDEYIEIISSKYSHAGLFQCCPDSKAYKLNFKNLK